MADNQWKDLSNEQLIMYRATEQNKWQILEHFANNDPALFNKIVKKYVKVKKVSGVIYTLGEISEHYKDFDIELLPGNLQELIKIADQKSERLRETQLYLIERAAVASRQRKMEKKLSWEREAGFPLVLFDINGLTPKTRDDYFAIFMRYMSENLTLSQFCRKYNISSELGFKEMLDKFSTESVVYAQQLKIKHETKQEQDINTINKLIDDVCYNGEPVALLVENNDLASLYEWQYQAQNYKGQECCNILREKVIDYFYDRVNSYDFYGYDPENIKKMLSTDELLFIVGKAEFESMLAGRKGAVNAPFLKSVLELGNVNSRLINQKVRGKTNDRLEKALNYYSDKFDKHKYFENTNMVMGTNGQPVEVTPEIVNRAYQFVYSNGLFPSDMVMSRAIRGVACEKIDNKEQTAAEMAELIKQADIMVSNIKNIEEYLEYINNCTKE